MRAVFVPQGPGTPRPFFAALRRQPNSTEKSVIATIPCTEQRPFKTPQLPAPRAVVREPAPQKRRFFLLLLLSSLGKRPGGEETGSLCTGGTAAQDWPETAGRGRDAVPPRRRAHSRSHGQTGGQWQREKMFFLCIAHQELICGRSCALRFF